MTKTTKALTVFVMYIILYRYVKAENNTQNRNPGQNSLTPSLTPNSKALKDVKVYLLTAQAVVMPGDTVANGILSFFKNMGTGMDSLTQGINSLSPTINKTP